MIGYLLWIRLKGFFTELRNPWKIVLHLVLLLTVYAYGRLFESTVVHPQDAPYPRILTAWSVRFVPVNVRTCTAFVLISSTVTSLGKASGILMAD